VPATDPNSQELNRRAAAVSEILGRIGLSGVARNTTEWWNLVGYKELGGRTPTQAWLAGDYESVEQLVLEWFDRSEEAADRARGDDAFLHMLAERRRTIREHSASEPRSA
jgi:hypothetical protein